MSRAEPLRRFPSFRRRRRITPPTMPVMDHLSELRRRLVVSATTFFVASLVAFFVFAPILDLLLRPLCAIDPERLGPQGCRLVIQSPLEGFLVRLKVTAMVGIVVSAPVWLYQLWAFIVPGLTDRERRYSVPFMLSTVTLFLIGTMVAYLTLPTGLSLLVQLGGDDLVPFFRAEEYLNFAGLMLIGFGLTFQLPLFLYFLGLVGVVSVEQLRHHRRLAVVAIVALSAVVTPSQDPYTLFALALPLYMFYELAIGLLVLRRRRKSKAQ